jgi:hypothetical protein
LCGKKGEEPCPVLFAGCPAISDACNSAPLGQYGADHPKAAGAAAGVALALAAAPVAAEAAPLLARIAAWFTGGTAAAGGAAKVAADSRTVIPEGNAVLAIVRNGKLVTQTADIMMSHARLVEKTFGSSTLPSGTWVGTVGKIAGQINALNSNTIMGNQAAAPAAIQELMRSLFR